MPEEDPTVGQNSLRSRAERELSSSEITENTPLLDIQKLVHELRVHKVELEMQNDELWRTQAELELSRLRYAELFEFAPIPYLMLDRHGVVLEANLRAFTRLGVDREALIGMPLVSFIAKEQRPLFRSRMQSLSKDGQCQIFELTIHGREDHFHARVNAVLANEHHDGGRCRVSLTDVSDLKRAEEALRVSQEEIQRIASSLLVAQERERARIARDIHDSMGQCLAAIKFGLETAMRARGRNRARQMEAQLQRLVPFIQFAVEDARRIYMGLRPTILDDLGICATIDWMCREFNEMYPVNLVGIHADIREDLVPEDLKIVVFRVAQEALNNIAIHSEAGEAELTLESSRGVITLTISDDGCGFDLDEASRGCSPGSGIGLAGMKERTELSGGEFSLTSALGKGTVVRASWHVWDD